MRKHILFVCTGNSCRSVMAEGIFRHLTSGNADISVSSAGISAMDGYYATNETIKVMREKGIDATTHRTKRLTVPMLLTADRIFVMETYHRDWVIQMAPEAEEQTYFLAEFSDNPDDPNIADPIRMPDTFYRDTFNVIEGCVKKIIKEFGY